jgi:two-component system chemotaxis sensor kinase CheA
VSRVEEASRASLIPRAGDSVAVPKESAAAIDALTLRSVSNTVRVDIAKLDHLMNVVAELALVRSAVGRVSEKLRGRAELRQLAAELQRVQRGFERHLGQLQEGILDVRMVPLGQVFEKLARVVRQVARDHGKEIRLVVTGAETEVDKLIVEELSDPLMHVIRNAIDHGIEPVADRTRAGKPRAGTLALNAFPKGSHVLIEIEDDGAGMDPERLRETAVRRGVVSAEYAAEFSRSEALSLIFLPGFSTRDSVTDLSGRGVGMDVVKTNIEAIGGTVDIASRPGRGTTVRVRVPLTLAIIPALVVRCGSERFALPQAAVGELVSLRGDGGPRIEGLSSGAVIRMRGRLVPVIFLDEFLGLRPITACRDDGTVVLVRVDDHEFGLVVDGARTTDVAADAPARAPDESHAVGETASLSTIVVKPIGSMLAQLGIYSGATVLGDGGVVLILDLRGILRAANLPSVERAETQADNAAVQAVAGSYLVCRTGAGRRIALPLDSVTRLETFGAGEFQPVSGRQVVRRGGMFTPVVDADSLLGSSPGVATDDTAVKLVVLDDRCGGVGIAVRQILDVSAAESPLQPALAAAGIAGTLALGGLATELLDLTSLLPAERL